MRCAAETERPGRLAGPFCTLWRRLVRTVVVVVVLVAHVVHGGFVAVAEAVAVVVMEPPLHGRMLVPLVIVGVLMPVLVPIPARGFHAVMEALPLNIPVIIGGLVPGALLVEAGGRRRRGIGTCGQPGGYGQRDCERGKGKPIVFHAYSLGSLLRRKMVNLIDAVSSAHSTTDPLF